MADVVRAINRETTAENGDGSQPPDRLGRAEALVSEYLERTKSGTVPGTSPLLGNDLATHGRDIDALVQADGGHHRRRSGLVGAAMGGATVLAVESRQCGQTRRPRCVDAGRGRLPDLP